jgi:DNA-binding MarR family transcriptional regulator
VPPGEDRDFGTEALVPALLRSARATYARAIRRDLDDAGCGDVPRNGAYVLGAIERFGAPLSEIIRWMGVSKQAAGQVVDALVVRGYLERSADPEDRRRMNLTLTDRGHLAAAAARGAVEKVDRRLSARVGDEHVAHTRQTLAALIEIGLEADPDS